MRAKRKKTVSRSSLRIFEVAEVVARSAMPIGLDAISKATRIPKSSAHRLIKVLVDHNVLLREAGAKHYSAGERLFALIVDGMSKVPFQTERRAILRGLVDQIGETCNFATLDGTDVIYVDRVESAWPLRFHLHPGSRLPIHCTATGKIFLSHVSPRIRRRVLYGAPLKRFTPRTNTVPEQLERELVRVRKTRVATDDEGFMAGMVAVAVPVYGRDRRVIASLAVHAPVARLSLEGALKHLPALRRAASDLGMIYRRFR